MARTAQPPDGDDIGTERDIDEVFGRANPNPGRVGCPPHEELVQLASRRLPLGSPGYEHLSTCSPCYREFRALQQRGSTTRAGARRSLTLALVAAVLVAIVAGWWVTRRTGRTDSSVTSVATTLPARVQLDLRRFTVTRSEHVVEQPAPLQMDAGLVDLTLLLPVGAEAGDYDVHLLDSQGRTRSEASGNAAIENFVTTLRVRMDVRGLAAGQYQLGTRRHGDSWRMYPVTLK